MLSKDAGESHRKAGHDKYASRLAFVEKALAASGKKYLLGDTFTVADGYMFYALRSWQSFFKNEVTGSLKAYYARVLDRPSVQTALAAEGFKGLV